MLSILPHPIRPHAWTVLSASYRVGTIYDDRANGGGWGWMLNPDGLQIGVVGDAASFADAKRLVAEKWPEQVALFGLGVGPAQQGSGQVLEASPSGEDYFLIMSNRRMVGDIEVVRAGRAGLAADQFRWTVGDHPDERNRIGFASSIEEAMRDAGSGWRAWLGLAGLRTL